MVFGIKFCIKTVNIKNNFKFKLYHCVSFNFSIFYSSHAVVTSFYGSFFCLAVLAIKARFHYERGKEHFFVSFVDLRLKRAVKIEASAKKKIKQTKNALFHARSGNGPLALNCIKIAIRV